MKKNLIRLIAGQACLHTCMTGMRMAAPLLALRQGYSVANVGVLLALFALTQVFLALPSGRYADKHGLKRPVMLSVLASSLGALLAEPGFRRLLIVNWFLSASWDMHTFVVPLLGHERGISASAIGAVLGGFALSAALIRIVLPWLAKRWQEWQVIALAMLFTSVLLALYPLAHAAWAMGMMSALLGLSLGSVQPMVMSSLHQLLPPDRQGEGLGLRLMLVNASSVAMPMLFGSLGAWLGVAAVFWCGAATVGAGSRLAWGLRRG